MSTTGYRRIASVFVAVLLFAGVVLGEAAGASTEGERAGVDVAAPQPLVAPSESTDPQIVEPPCPEGSYEGCYSYDEMQTYLDRMIELVEPLFVDVYGLAGSPAVIWYVPAGDIGNGACGMFDSTAFFYCALDRSVYIGQDELWFFYTELGDAAPALGLAHEWGHHVQTFMGVPRGTSPTEWVVHERQADCISGAWLAYADEQGFVEYPDDMGDVDRALALIAAAEDDPHRTHGTLQERHQSLNHGLSRGLAGCNDYFPDTPVYPE